MRRRGPALRRWLSAGCLAAAVGIALPVLAPGPAPGRPVVVAARDVPAGAALQAGDVRLVRWPAADLPASALGEPRTAVGRVLASPVQSGEILTSARLVGPGLLAGQPPSTVALPVRFADAAAAAVLVPGLRLDVLGATRGRGELTLARGATVLAVAGRGAGPDGGGLGLAGGSTGGSAGSLDGAGSGPPGGALDGSGGGLVLLAVPEQDAQLIVRTSATVPLTYLLR